MPLPGKRWRHVILSVRGSWLHGDPRGFHSRGKRITSSGDYKNPPPSNEHAGLHRFHSSRTSKPVSIPVKQRAIVGDAIVELFNSYQCQIVCVAVSGFHAHALVELPDNLPEMRRIVGYAKEKSSRAVNKSISGFRWAQGATFTPVDSIEHHRKAYRYILTRQGPMAWTWSYNAARPAKS